MNSNVIFAEDVEKDESVLDKADLFALKESNFDVFNRYFSKDAFVSQYKEFFEKILVEED